MGNNVVVCVNYYYSCLVFSKALGYGLGFAGIALVLAGIMSIGSYYYSDKIVLATTGAKEIKKSDNPELFRTVENLCIGDGLPMPKSISLTTRPLTLLQQEEILGTLLFASLPAYWEFWIKVN